MKAKRFIGTPLYFIRVVFLFVGQLAKLLRHLATELFIVSLCSSLFLRSGTAPPSQLLLSLLHFKGLLIHFVSGVILEIQENLLVIRVRHLHSLNFSMPASKLEDSATLVLFFFPPYSWW